MGRNRVIQSRHADIDLIPERQFLHGVLELIIALLIDHLDIIHWRCLAALQFLGRLVLRAELPGEGDLGLHLRAVDVGG